MQRRRRTNETRIGNDDLPLQSRFNNRNKKAWGTKQVTSLLALFVSVMVIFALAMMHFTNDARHKPEKTVTGASASAVHDTPDSNQRPSPIVKDSVKSTAKEGVEQEYHLIFSTGCSVYQDWQSYVFFYHALKSGQKGRVTRIASGCEGKDAEDLQKLHKEQIGIMSDRFHLHLTPEYSKVKPGLDFKYFNKPFGLKHWMENALGFPDSPENEDAIIILMDPDQILLRPFTNDFTGSSEVWRSTGKSRVPLGDRVKHGSPFAQRYGYSLQWKTKVNMTHVAGGKPSRIDGMDMEEATAHYAVGPPYIVTAKDMYAIAETWCEFCPRVYDNYPHLLAEMFAYSLAAAHLNLPHRVAEGFMVSEPVSGAEGWKVIDEMEPKERICKDFPYNDLPHVVHYCQRYLLGKWFILKYRLRGDFISCESPLLMEPPPSIVEKNYQISPDGSIALLQKPVFGRRHAFMLCTLIPGLNEAATFFKDHHCEGKGNYNKTYIFHKKIEE